jgi:hypothetical protein
MRCGILTLVLVAVGMAVGCKDDKLDSAPPPPHDGVTLIQRGVAPFQALRYRLTRGTRTTSQLICDLDVKNDGDSGPMPVLIVDLDTAVDDVLADGSAKLRVTIARTSVRDRPGSPVTSDVVLAQASAMQGVVITETLAPDGQLADSHVDAAAPVPERAREQLDRLSRSLSQVAMRMPSEPVGVGAIWRERRTLPDGGIRAVSETLYTLTSLTGTTIAYSSVGLSSGEPQTIEQDGMKVEVTHTRGHSQASGSVDLSRYAFDVTSTSSFATAMNVVAPEGTPGAGPSTVEITMAIRVKPADGAPPPPNDPSGDAQPPSIASGSTQPSTAASHPQGPAPTADPSPGAPTRNEPPAASSATAAGITAAPTPSASPGAAPSGATSGNAAAPVSPGAAQSAPAAPASPGVASSPSSTSASAAANRTASPGVAPSPAGAGTAAAVSSGAPSSSGASTSAAGQAGQH